MRGRTERAIRAAACWPDAQKRERIRQLGEAPDDKVVDFRNRVLVEISECESRQLTEKNEPPPEPKPVLKPRKPSPQADDSQGDYPKALEWNRKALAIKEKMPDKEHLDTAATYNDIAVAINQRYLHQSTRSISPSERPRNLSPIVWNRKGMSVTM
jgi:hypothetical protein